MKTKMPLRRFTNVAASIFAAAVLTGGAIASADQTYSIKLHLNKGDKWSFDTTSSMEQKGQVLANGQLAQPIEQSMSQHRAGTAEITALDNGLPIGMRITFDRDCTNSAGAGAQQPPPFALAGKTVNLTKQNGIVLTDAEKIDSATNTEVAQMLDVDTSAYPKEPVAINQEWDGDTTALAKAFQLAANDKASIKCKLDDVHKVNGREVAEITLAGKILKHEQGFIEETTTLDGKCSVDLQTGQIIEMKAAGKITMTGATQQQAPDGTIVKVTLSATGDLKVHNKVTLGDAKPAVADGPGFLGKPAPLPGPGKTPIDIPSDKDAGPFSGNFKGDQVGLQLTDTAGQVNGTLTVGEKKFPLTGKSDGKKLTGSFDSDGTKFDFTATLDGSTLTLTSEGNTYTLKKPASANPLAKPQPKNPLAE